MSEAPHVRPGPDPRSCQPARRLPRALPETRHRSEELLLTEHFERLQEHGAGELTWKHYQERYRHGAAYGIYLAVVAAMMVEQTERGDQMFITSTTRHVQHALELGTFEPYGSTS